MVEQKGFWSTFCELIRILKPFPATLLVVLSILETALVAKVGQVSGQYYLIIVDRQPSTFLRLSMTSLALYVCNTLVKSSSRWLSEFLALRWRGKLTSLLQHGYCKDQNFFWIHKDCDNADQRITQDVKLFCQRLASIALVIAAVPFQAVYYTFWTYQITSVYVVLAAYTFFLVSLLLESTIIKPVASLVFKQERAEGNFRFGHMRLRALLKEVALYKAAEAEKAHLELLLQPVLANQLRLVMWRWLLNACITGLDYAGALLTYTCLGLLVFTEIVKCLQALHLPADNMTTPHARQPSMARPKACPELEPLLGDSCSQDAAAGLHSAFPLSASGTHEVDMANGTQHDRPAISLDGHDTGEGDTTPPLQIPISQQHSALAVADLSNGASPGSDAVRWQAASARLQQCHQHGLPTHCQSAQHDAHSQESQNTTTAQTQCDLTQRPNPPCPSERAHTISGQCSALDEQQSTAQQLAVVSLVNFTCQRPDGATVVRQISMQLGPGQALLITGHSGAGKTTLVNALAGLWPQWHGYCQMPSADQVMFVPQTPVAAPGPTLLEQILYPQALLQPADVDLPALQQLLRQVKLEHLLQRAQGLWAMPMDWTGMLSPGELQRLAVARVLYHRPALAVMDEPISSLDAETGISLLKTIHTAGIAVIVTSQPDTPLCNVQQSMSWQMLSL